MMNTTELAIPTGGQLNVAGILYQMLVSLNEGLDATITAVESSGEVNGVTVEIQPEPFDGGDVQVGGRQRLVVQIKRRAAGRYWTVGDVIRDVLPDLIKAVRPEADDRFQFVTDNDEGCDNFRRFLAWHCARMDLEGPEPAEERFRFRRGMTVTGQELLAAIPGELGIESDDVRLPVLLYALEILKRDEADLVREIDKSLSVLVERVEDVPHKRTQLLGELVRLGARGARVTTTELLRGAQLEPRRLVHAGQLAQSLRKELTAAFPMFRYVPETDVRRPLPAPTRSVTVLRGESGLGKTWRLCATARTMADAGRPVILLRASADIDRMRERIATAVWNPTYSQAAPLPSIAARLRPALADQRKVWLTVFLDDLNDQELARSVIEDDWRRLGIDLVISSQPATADWLARSAAAPEVIEVAEFTPLELFAYLAEHGLDQSSVPDDILELLFKPIMASLYCALPHGLIPRAETEYELMQSLWKHASENRPAQPRHDFDLARLEMLVGGMLAEPPIYPWPPASVARTLDPDAVGRLVLRGLVELDGRFRLSMTHDRLLNWAMARHLVDQAIDRNLSPQELQDLLRRTQDVVTVAGVRIGARLGYVLMDLLWLLLEPGRWSIAQVAAFLLTRMRDPEFDAYDRRFFRETLATLGARGVPLLRAIVGQDLGADRERHWPGWLAEGMRKAADTAWKDVREAATGMFTSGNLVQMETALRVLAKVDAPALLNKLHDLNMRRVRAADDRIDHIQSKQRAFDAFARAAAGSPCWLDRRIAATTDGAEAEQLLWALVQQRRSAALPIWEARRDHLFANIGPGARVLPHAVRAFADLADLPRLRLPPPEGADMLHGAVTFDAIVKLDSDRAIGILRSDIGDDALDLHGTEGWWIPSLHFRTRDRLGAALRERARTNNHLNAADMLARLYASHPEFLEDKIVDILLDGLQAMLTNGEGTDEERLRRSYRLLSTLSSARTVPALATIAASTSAQWF